MKRKLKVTNKKRFFIFSTFLLIVFIIIFVITVFANESVVIDKHDSNQKHIIYIVDMGDTLWDIAVENKGNSDVRTYLYKIKKLNELSSSDIFIGQQIKLP